MITKKMLLLLVCLLVLSVNVMADYTALPDSEFTQMFNGKDLTGWQTTGNWVVEDGIVTLKPRKGEWGWQRFKDYIMTEREYGNFVLKLDFKILKKGNSGVFMRVGDPLDPVNKGFELQILDTHGKENPGHHDCGGIIRTAGPSKNMVKPAGEWNEYIVCLNGNSLKVTLNGEQIQDLDLSKTVLKDRPAKGRIGFQDEAKRVWYRNVRIKELPDSPKDKDMLDTHISVESYPGWRPSVQMWSFKEFTLFEGIDKAVSLGLNTIEMYPGQVVSKETGNVKTNNMPADVRDKLKAKLKSAGIEVKNYGVVGLPKDEAKSRKVFEFAKEMGIETIVSEPGFDAFDMLDKLCQEYKIKVAIHNHPKPTRYWNPDTVLKVLEGRSKWIGVCVDTGHLTRSGIDPVEAIKKYEGRVISLHLKDVNQFGIGRKGTHDVPWGTGKSNIKAVLTELDRQGFKGVFSAEYEHNWSNNVPDIRKCMDFFNKTAAELRPGGWRNLFADDLSDGVTKGKWTNIDGVLTRNGGGDLGTKGKYSNFVLDCGFKLAENSNSGVFIRMGNRKWIPWLEVQVEDSYNEKITTHTCGGVFDVYAPKVNAVKPGGEWNRLTIKADGSRVQVVINGQQTVDMDLNDWDTANKNPDKTRNKFKIAYKDLPREGYIALQDHGQAIEYRNVRILELE